MELRKFFYKSYHSKPKIKLKKILNDNLFFKRSLILKMALNKNVKINTNYRIDRLKTDKNLSNIKKPDNDEDSFENKRYEEMERKKNLLNELENILENNAKKTETFIESFKDLKEENNKFITEYDDIKIPVEERIKRFIINTIKLFKDNKIEINLRSKPNKTENNILENEVDDLNDLWGQNKAAIKLFKQCPLTLKNEKDMYFYYIANYLGEKLNINDHKYIKYLKQIKDYLDDIKNERTFKTPSPIKIKSKNKRRKSQTIKYKQEIKKDNEEQKGKGTIKNMKKNCLNKVESSKIILDENNKFNKINNNSNYANKDLNNNNKEINNNSNINKSNNNFSNSDSKNKNTSINYINSTQEFPSKDTSNFVGISNYENKNSTTNIYNCYKNNLIKNKIKNLNCTTPNSKNLNNIRNNLNTKKKKYLNTCDNKKTKHIEKLKNEEELNKCQSTKKFTNNFNKTSFQDTNYTLHRMPSENLSNIKKNTLSKIKIKIQISPSPKQLSNISNILSRNNNKSSTMNLFRYINNIKLTDKNNNFIDISKNKKNNILTRKISQHIDKLKITKKSELSPIKPINYNLLNIYEKAKRNNILNEKNLMEINEYLKRKGINNNDILKQIQFNSDNAFINLKSQTNKLNIEAKTKAFFYGIIPSERRKKIDQLRDLNIKINQIERDYIKTLIDKDLQFKK